MDNNQINQISGSSSSYDPNNLSIFPDLLQPVDPDVPNQALQPPAVLPEHFGGENARHHPTRIVTVVAQGIYHDEENNVLLVLEQGTGGAPNQTLNNNQAGWMLPRPSSNTHSSQSQTLTGTTTNHHLAGRSTDPRPTSHIRPAERTIRERTIRRSTTRRIPNIHPAGRSNDSRPTPEILREERTILRPTPRRIPNIHPSGRTVSTTRPDLYPRRVPTRRRSAASSRAQVQNSDAPSRLPYPTLDVPNIPPREASPIPDQPQAGATISNCAIYMNPFLDPTAAKCGHVFCGTCIYNAYELQRRCPMCRKSINTRRDLLRIYLN